MDFYSYICIVMSYPSTFTSVFARNCSVRRIEAPQAKAFLQANHRYGWSRCKYCYGLFVERKGGGVRDCSGSEGFETGTLVGVATFSNARRWKKGAGVSCDGNSTESGNSAFVIRSYEWVRYASLVGVRIQGGMGKLLKAFIQEVDPDDIMTYAPLPVGDDGAPVENGDEGQAYTLLGFTLEDRKEFDGGISLKFRLKLREY